MPSFQQQVLVFQRQVRGVYEAGLDKTKRKLELFKKSLKSDSLGKDDKEFLEITVSELESQVKTFKELIAQTRRRK